MRLSRSRNLGSWLILLVTALAGFTLLVSYGFILSSDSLFVHDIEKEKTSTIEIYRQTYWAVQMRHRLTSPIAVPAQVVKSQEQGWLTEDAIEYLKSTADEIDHIYAYFNTPGSWEGQPVTVVQATPDYFEAKDWQLVAGMLPRSSNEALATDRLLTLDPESSDEEWLGRTINVKVQGQLRSLQIVGIVRVAGTQAVPGVFVPATPGGRWTSMVAVATPGSSADRVAATIQRALDLRYGENVWRAESTYSQVRNWVEARNRVRAANRWIGLMSLLLAGATIFGLAFSSENRLLSRHALARALGQTRLSLGMARVAEYTSVGILGGMVGATIGQLVFPWVTAGPSPFTTPASARPGLDAVILSAAAVGAVTVVGCLWPVWQATRANIAGTLRSAARQPEAAGPAPIHLPPRIRRLIDLGAGLSILQMSLSIALLVSLVSTDQAVRSAITAAGLNRIMMVYPSGSTGAVGWTTADLESLRSLPDTPEHILALGDSGEAYVQSRSNSNNPTYSALVRSGTESLARIYGWRLVAGNMISDLDVDRQAKVAVIAHEMGQLLWDEDDPAGYIGKQVWIQPTYYGQWIPLTVVGVIAPAAQELSVATESVPALLVPLGVFPGPNLPDGTPLGRYLTAKPTKSDDTQLATLLQKVAPNYLHPAPVSVEYTELAPAKDLLRSLDRERDILSLQLLLILLTAATGMFAFRWLDLAYRTRELGIARTLGSTRLRILADAVLDSGALLVAASLVGLVAALIWAPGLIRPLMIVQLLYTTEYPAIPLLTRQGVALGILVAATTAGVFSIYPAWAAARTSPLEAVREGNEL